MRKFRRHRKRVEWVDTHSSQVAVLGAQNGIFPYSQVLLDGPDPQPEVTVATPVIIGDEPAFDANKPTLMEERKAYTIRRIVGRQHWEWGTDGVDEGDNLILYPALYKWGFCVQDIDDESPPYGPEAIHSLFARTEWAEMDWMHTDTVMLGSQNVQAAPSSLLWLFDDATSLEPNFGYTGFPSSELHSPEASRIDIKVNRKVDRNQRLFFVQSVCPYSPGTTAFSVNHHKLLTYLDVRILINWSTPSSARRS